jgi:hypothetical protein
VDTVIIAAENWEYVGKEAVAWDTLDAVLHAQLGATVLCCGWRLGLKPGVRAVCPGCLAEYSIGFTRAVLVARDSVGVGHACAVGEPA